MKRCKKCGIEKPLSEFHKGKVYKDGHRSVCKSCIKKEGARYYLENKQKIAEYSALYRKENKEKIARYRRENKDKIAEGNARYRKENKEKIARYRRENKDKIAEQNARYRQENKEKIAEYNARYRQENKEKLAERMTIYYQQNKEKEPACIYQIKNKQNGKIYIGETLRGELRWKGHLSSLRGGYHNNSLLQKDFDEFGEEVFEWEILKEFPKNKEILLLEEVRTISRFLKEDKDLYNLSLTIEQLKLLQENGE